MAKSLKVLALLDALRPVSLLEDLRRELRTPDWKTERDVLAALSALGHRVAYQAIYDDIDLVRQACERFRPDVIFNLADQFRDHRHFDMNIAALLELRGIPFTGCGSLPLALCKDKSIAKRIVAHARIDTPDFFVATRGRTKRLPSTLKYPLIVKPLREEASVGISDASLASDLHAARAAIRRIHETCGDDALVESYIHGREFYVSVIGSDRPAVLPLRELNFGQKPARAPRIATHRAKWDEAYRRRWNVRNEFARGLDPSLERRIRDVGRRAYQLLQIDGYARLDLRVGDDGRIYFLEANPNPILARDEDFAQSARKVGWDYATLIQRLIRQAAVRSTSTC